MKEKIREILKEVFEKETLVNSIVIRGTINKATEKCNELFETEAKNISSNPVLAVSLPISQQSKKQHLIIGERNITLKENHGVRKSLLLGLNGL